MEKTPLCEILESRYSDKCPQINHSYSSEYYRLFDPIKYSAKTLIEIGVGNNSLMVPIVGSRYTPGASLKAWSDFFPNAKIIGLDIDTSVLFTSDRIECFYMDQSSEESIISTIDTIKKLYNNISIIIDDGSHIMEHMTLSYSILKNYLDNNGLYIIEDIKKKDLQYFINLCEKDNNISIEYVHEGNNDWDSFVAYKKLPLIHNEQ
jgi:cephalosporin hydroxylase